MFRVKKKSSVRRMNFSGKDLLETLEYKFANEDKNREILITLFKGKKQTVSLNESMSSMQYKILQLVTVDKMEAHLKLLNKARIKVPDPEYIPSFELLVRFMMKACHERGLADFELRDYNGRRDPRANTLKPYRANYSQVDLCRRKGWRWQNNDLE